MKKLLAAAFLSSLSLSTTAFAWETPPTPPTPPQTINNGGAGGAGGSARSIALANATAVAAQSQGQRQRQSQSATGGQVVVNGSVGSNNQGPRAPDLSGLSIGGGGADCPIVGVGVGGTGQPGGGLISGAWISSDCNARKVTEVAIILFGPEVARAYAEKHLDGIHEAVEDVAKRRAQTPAAPIVAASATPTGRDGWCGTASRAELRNHPECAR